MAKRQSAFTLIEILIVVIILGILAAIVIPQFTNASEDAKLSSVQSTVQSIRSQVELYKLQHGDAIPPITGTGGIDFWTALTGTSVGPDGKTYGPYLQAVPVNPFNNNSLLTNTTATSTVNGWAVINSKFYGLGKNKLFVPAD